MATNALAPASRNALSRGTDPLQTLLKQAAETPQYGDLVEYLSSRRMMPPMRQTPLGSVAEFESPSAFSGSNIPKTGVISLSYSATPQSVVHELTHAAQRQMEAQYYELENKYRSQGLTPQEKQFMQAYEKLIYDSGRRSGNKSQTTQSLTAQRIAPPWYAEKKSYRASGPELSAFGMGSAVAPNVGYPAPLHVDPTYATEFSILLDMANRLQKSQPVTDKR